MDDATHALLQDFVDSLSNLPSEIGHLLCEIAYLDYAKKPAKDDQPPVSQAGNGESGSNKRWYSVDESRRKASSKQSSIVRHSHKPPNNLLTPNPKESLLIERALAHYDDAIKLSQEKEKFAARAVSLVSRHLDRLNHELTKLEATTGVEIPDFRRETSEALPSTTNNEQASNHNSATPAESRQKRKYSSAEAALPLSLPPLTPMNSTTTDSGSASNKRRLTNSRLTIRMSVSSGTNRESGARQPSVDIDKGALEEEAGGAGAEQEEEEEEGVEEGEESNAGDDTTLYCFCQKVSYGEMIGCDNKTCKYEWFHVPCLGLKETPTGKWYCPQCTAEGKGQKSANTGRNRKRA
ncbi:hypothetical protein BY996DRAFT_7869736 [Phakopsora pachyrhizi]|uniref:Chromatin modification-related protein n=1 Tax=Phakopsora pachyrhizi TaxID=170000 RepID=A0AAV0AR85_PHAPC|nr:hypothetical protein BY996DRAFT_7869736 [Phakopsora pachyrhizi]CAH7670525.1 hypothetical protein PPACK8108_LOCUS5249 [Phakopsora pachyrhizi]